MSDFVHRLIDEEKELDAKIEKLHVFIEDSPTFGELSKMERERLRDQRYVMRLYRRILRERISALPRSEQNLN